MTSLELARRYVNGRGYKLLFEDNVDMVSFRYKLNTVHVLANVNDPNFILVTIPQLDEAKPDTRQELMARCYQLSSELQAVKFYMMNDVVVATAEFYYKDEADFDFLFDKSLQLLCEARGEYRKRVWGE